jgi:hypothetical protein
MPVKGVIILHVQVGDLRTRVRFYVVPGLGVPCILGCNFIDLHVRSIHPKEKRVDLREGGSVDITTDTRLSSVASTSIREPNLSRKVRLARLTTIPARSEAHIEVTSACHGLFLVVPYFKSSAPYSLKEVGRYSNVSDRGKDLLVVGLYPPSHEVVHFYYYGS